MHEHSFIQAIINNIKDQENVKEILLEVGELAGIESEHLKEHLEEEKPTWNIYVTEKKASVTCTCGYLGRPRILQRLHDMVIYECPRCKQIPKATEGQHIKIIKVIYHS